MTADEIRKRLRSKQTQEGIGAVKSASRLEGDARQALLLGALGDKSHYVAALAAEALGEQAYKAALAMTERFVYLSEDGPTRHAGRPESPSLT